LRGIVRKRMTRAAELLGLGSLENFRNLMKRLKNNAP
jgi:hypothetical protein